MKLKLCKEFKTYSIIFCIAFVLCILSVVIFFVKNNGKRRSLIFPSAESGALIIETRYLPSKPVQGDIQMFIDELLLGSGVERTKMLFTPGTKVKSCFLRGDILYLDLSDDLMQMGNGVIDIKDGVELLRKNIKLNFSKVKTVQIFVNGQIAFE